MTRIKAAVCTEFGKPLSMEDLDLPFSSAVRVDSTLYLSILARN